jgi:C-terminal binding protein
VTIVDSRRGGYVPDTSIESEVLASLAEVALCPVESASEAADHLQDADVVISWHHIPLSRADLELMPRCKGIVRASVGFDNIALDAASELDIPVCNVPDYGTEEVADHTLMLLLGISRNMLGVAATTRRGEWQWQAAGSVRRLRGRRLGIVGLGRIGTAVAVRALSFGLRVTCFDPFVPSGIEKSLGIERAESLDELLASIDILTLHVPLTHQTRRMIGPEEFRLLPEEAIVINTSRGEVIDQHALVRALLNGRIAGAGLDVLENEPTVPVALREHERVVLTAHSAFFSAQSLVELRVKAARAAERFLRGERKHRDNLVDSWQGVGARISDDRIGR